MPFIEFSCTEDRCVLRSAWTSTWSTWIGNIAKIRTRFFSYLSLTKP